MRSLICAGLLWLAAGAGWASEALVDRLAQALRLSEVVQILSAEGLEHGAALDAEMLAGAGGAYFADQVQEVFDPADMVDALKSAMAQGMSEAALQDSLVFFESDLGRRIIGLELSARQAFGDPDIEAMAVERLGALPADDPALALVRRYVDANELVTRNVSGMQGTDFAFYLGLAQGGAYDRDDEAYLAGLLEDRDQMLAETEEWALSFHLMAYDPLSVAEQQANIDYSLSAAGQAFNVALFEGFDRMYEDLFYRLGLLVAQAMTATDL